MSRREDREFEGFRDEIEAASRKVAREIDPGVRAVFVAVLVLVLAATLILPHCGSVAGYEVLTFSPRAVEERVAVTSRVFMWLVVVFGIGASMLALLTRRWAVALIALAGGFVATFAGLLAFWSRNTPGVDNIRPPSGPGLGLYLAWAAMALLTVSWARIVWDRSVHLLSLEEERRRLAAEEEAHNRRLRRRER